MTQGSATMVPQQSFGVTIRTVGLIILVYGLYDSLHTAIELAGGQTRIHEPYVAGIIFSLFWLTVGVVLLFAADAIARLAYGSTSN